MSEERPKQTSSPRSANITELIAKRLREQMMRAFWDLTREQLSATPPNFESCFQLLGDVVAGIQTLVPNQNPNSSIQMRIKDIFDFPRLRKEVEDESIDINELIVKILTLLGELCAPVRDDQLKKLQEELEKGGDSFADHLVKIFKGILEFIELMKEDMAKMAVMNMSKADIQRQQFHYLYFKQNDHPPRVLCAWLKGAKDSSTHEQMSDTELIFCKMVSRLLILPTNEPMIESIPDEHVETCRFFSIQMSSSVLLTSICLLIKQAFETKIHNYTAANISKDVQGVLNDLDSTGNSQQTKLTDRMGNVSRYCEGKFSNSGAQTMIAFKKSITDLIEPSTDEIKQSHPVISIVKDRLISFVSTTLYSTLKKQPLPKVPGISKSVCTDNLLQNMTAAFVAIFKENYEIFSPTYKA